MKLTKKLKEYLEKTGRIKEYLDRKYIEALDEQYFNTLDIGVKEQMEKRIKLYKIKYGKEYKSKK